MRKAAQCGSIYRKTYKISAASTSNSSSKLGKNGERLEIDNPVGSNGSEQKYIKPLTTSSWVSQTIILPRVPNILVKDNDIVWTANII